MRKSILKMFSMLFAGMVLLSCPVIAQNTDKKEGNMDMGKVLVVYYSYSGNTAEAAKIIQKETGGDIFEIQTVKTYPKEYNDLIAEAKEEINKGDKPAIKGKVNNINDYDVIYIGSPNWWGTIAPAVTAFLSEYDLSGKKVAPFFTHGGGGMQRCASDTAKLLPNSTVLEAITFSGSRASQKDIKTWIEKINK